MEEVEEEAFATELVDFAAELVAFAVLEVDLALEALLAEVEELAEEEALEDALAVFMPAAAVLASRPG